MGSVVHRRGHDDAQLARRAGAGDGAAFAILDARHRGPLTRYAGSLLRRSEHDAEDVVQDVLIRAHQALRTGEVPDEMRSWLYRLTRNRSIDEVRRKRWGDESLDPDHAFAGDARDDPHATLRRKESVRRLVEDLADLPVRQREALLAREVDGLGPEQVAAQLGVSVAAARKLAMRARANLVKTRDARDADCDVVRADLLEAHERGVRPSEHGLRHLKGCDACHAYRRDVRGLSTQLRALNPTLGLPVVAGIAKLLGGGGKATLAAGAALAIASTGGVIVLAAQVHDAGDRAPYRFNAGYGRGSVKTGGSIPSGAALVTTHVELPAGAPARGEPRSVTLSCPKPMRFAGPVRDTERRDPIAWEIRPAAIYSVSTRARIVFPADVLPRAVQTDVAILCLKADASGSTVANPRRPQRGERAGRVCVKGDYLKLEPDRIPIDRVRLGQPLAIQRRSPSGAWTRVVLDTHLGGWIKTSDLCR